MSLRLSGIEFQDVGLAYSNATRKHEPVSPLLRDLQWLPLPQRIEFKLAVLTYRCLHSMAPPYLADGLHRVADIDSFATAP